MRYFITLCSMLGLTATALAETPADVNTALDRGLAFVAKDAMAWKSEHNCVSCHHAGLAIWALREAKQRGHAVDEPVLAELTTWTAETGGNGTTGVPRPASVPRAFNEKAVSLALGLEADSAPTATSQEAIKRFLQTIVTDQIENGSWASWPETRPPLFGNSDDRATAAATLATLPAAAAGDAAAIAARDKGVKWLSETKTDDDPQSIALRVILWQRLGRPAGESQAWVARIRERQNADGGWGQTPELASDAWATGQALYALAEAGAANDDPAIARGQAFLVKAQQADGSWPMISRPTKPGGEPSSNLVPIIGAGSAWAVLGLAHSH